MEEDQKVKPMLIDSFSKVLDYFKKQGFNESDILFLIQKRTRPKQNITSIRATIEAVKIFEKQIERALGSNEE